MVADIPPIPNSKFNSVTVPNNNYSNINNNNNNHNNSSNNDRNDRNDRIIKPFKEQCPQLIRTNFQEVTFCNLSDNNTSSTIGALSLSTTNDDSKLNGSNHNNRNNSYYDSHYGINEIKNDTGPGAGGGNNNNVKKQNRKKLTSNGSADSLTTLSADKKKPEIPDGGFGWVVVFASLCVSLVADGVSFSFGLIYTELNAYFQESKSKTAWVGSLFLAVPLLVGPIMSNLVDKYGCRKMTIIGGIISSSGFALGSICNSIEMLYLTFGIISGLGLGIGYVTAVVSIAFWFDKKRTFATGIGASGTGIGTFLYAPFTQFLIDYYGWRGATLILAGTMLNTCVFGALMRDPDWLIEENRLESRSQSVTTFSNSSVCLDEIRKLLETGAPKEAVLDTLVTNYNTEANTQISDPDDSRAAKKYRSEIFLPTYLCSHDLLSVDELKRESRRSLRHKNERDTISRENLLSLSSDREDGGNNTTTAVDTVQLTTDTHENKKYLASIETLSPSEKMTTIPNTPLRSSFGGSLQTDDENMDYMMNKTFFDSNRQNRIFNGSRFSLNENLISRTNEDESFSSARNKYRGTSLDILRDDDVFNQHKLTHNNHNNDHHYQKDTTKPNGGIDEEKERMIKRTNIRKFEPVTISLTAGKKKQKSSLKRNTSLKNANYLKNMRIHRNSIHYRGAMLNTHRYRLRASSCPNIYRNSMTTIAREEEDSWYDSFVDIIKSMFDFSLFLDLKFAILNFSTLLLFIWYIIPYLYITEHMLKYEYKEDDSALVISTIGIFSTIGMVGLGFIGDRPWLNVNISYAICMILCGLSVALMPLVVKNFVLLLLANALFGITFASTFSFTPSIIVNLVDLDDFTIAYGLVLLVQGVGSLIGPPLAGLIYEITLRWDDAFYASGLFIAISGVLAYIIDILENRDKIKKKAKTGYDTDS